MNVMSGPSDQIHADQYRHDLGDIGKPPPRPAIPARDTSDPSIKVSTEALAAKCNPKALSRNFIRFPGQCMG